MIASKEMLATQRFPTTNNKWGELRRYVHTWGKWKELYKKADKKSKVKRQDPGGQDQFVGAVL